MCCEEEVKQYGYCQGKARVQPELETVNETTNVCHDHNCVNGECVVFAGTVSISSCLKQRC